MSKFFHDDNDDAKAIAIRKQPSLKYGEWSLDMVPDSRRPTLSIWTFNLGNIAPRCQRV